MRDESDISMEVVLLIVLGVFMFLLGLLLSKISTGELPYTPDSTYGLFLVIISFQIITMGKTPFGDLNRSWALIIMGVLVAILGMVSCFIPGYLSELVRILVGIILFAGGIVLLIKLFLSKEKAKSWIKIPGILRQLIAACALVYGITIISGLITLIPGITTNLQTAWVLCIYGFSFFYLAWCIHKVSRIYPEEKKVDDLKTSSKHFSFFQEAKLPLSSAIIILVGILLILLGILLFPVTFGLVPFSPDGQLGLLLVIVSIQMMALGETPMGQYKRSWLLIIIGIIFAALGIVSCIVPGILTGLIQIMIGVLNIFGGTLLLIKRFFPIFDGIKNQDPETNMVPPVVKKLIVTQTVLNIVSIIFGLSMILGGIIPGLIVACVLVINGILLFVLVILLQKIAQIETETKKTDFQFN